MISVLGKEGVWVPVKQKSLKLAQANFEKNDEHKGCECDVVPQVDDTFATYSLLLFNVSLLSRLIYPKFWKDTLKGASLLWEMAGQELDEEDDMGTFRIPERDEHAGWETNVCLDNNSWAGATISFMVCW